MNYIYTLIDPITNAVRYIGKTNNIKSRLKTHIICSKNKKTHKDFWIQRLLKLGVKPIIEVLEEIEIGCDWQSAEIYWISQFKLWGFNLVNSTDGGENPPKLKRHNDKTREKLSVIKKEYFKGKNHHRLGVKLTKEHLDKIKETKRKREYRISEETKNKLSKSHLKDGAKICYQYNLDGTYIKEWGCVNEASKFFKTSKILDVCNGKRKSTANFRWSFYFFERLDPLKVIEVKTKQNTKYIFSDEHKNNISIANKGKKRSEDFIINARNRKLGTKHSEEAKKKMSEKRMGKKIHTEEYKNKIRIKINQLDLDNNIVKRWNSISDAIKEYPYAKISECINKKRKTSYGYKWEKQ
jgi:group I intron endonuclease